MIGKPIRKLAYIGMVLINRQSAFKNNFPVTLVTVTKSNQNSIEPLAEKNGRPKTHWRSA